MKSEPLSKDLLSFGSGKDSLNLKVVGNEPIVKNSEEEISTDIPKKKPDFSKVPQSSILGKISSFLPQLDSANQRLFEEMQEAQDPSKFDIEHISDDDEDGDISPSHNEASSETSSFVQIFDSKDAKEQEKSMSKPHIEMNLTMLFDVLQEPSDLSITERVENFMKDLVGDKKEQSSSSKPKISLHSP